MSRIASVFAQLQQEGRTAVIPYIVAGDPAVTLTAELMHELVQRGADVIELGVPFSDPMAEGPVIQLGHERALAAGMTLRGVLELVTEFRRENDQTPVLLMGYANPVERMGYAAFADAAAQAGLDGLLTVDIPPEEVATLNRELQRVGIDNIFLVAPTTPAQRMQRIADEASGFIYYVSLKGVTGAGHIDTEAVRARLTQIRSHTALPIAVGFGIKDAQSARALAGSADGVVVGSALVDTVATALANGDDEAGAIAKAGALLAEIRTGVDGAAS